jgi:hypothetical protein
MWKPPKNSDKYFWTAHARMKMRHYGLSAQRITRVIRAPLRVEEGIAGQGTIAVMQPQSTKRDGNGEKTWSNEIWVMYKIGKKKDKKMDNDLTATMDEKMAAFLRGADKDRKQIRIISAWRYPGKTEPGTSLPEEICDEIAEVG